eukprot:10549465-Alexandrium_andersonii.AAC.1
MHEHVHAHTAHKHTCHRTLQPTQQRNSTTREHQSSPAECECNGVQQSAADIRVQQMCSRAQQSAA